MVEIEEKLQKGLEALGKRRTFGQRVSDNRGEEIDGLMAKRFREISLEKRKKGIR